jgi:hypothetical protein
MIHFLTTAHHTYPVGDYLKSWVGPSHPLIKILPYETLPSILPRGTYIFADLERLTSAQTALAGEVWNQLAAAGDGIRLLNHPLRATRRLALLQVLHEAGRNDFRAFRATDRRADPRFPVFVRRESEHEGSFTALLRDQTEVDQAIVRLLLTGVEVDDILIVEFCDTSRNGLFRKYSAFRVGDRIVPRHLMFSQKWVLKVPDLLDTSKIEEEREYLESNPHEQDLRDIFDRAHIDYGRIDYGLLDDRIQVWEINSNPIVMFPRDHYKRERLPAQELFAGKIRQAFESIDSPSPTQPMVPISLTECARRIRDS